jgi:hypothetical protein
MKWDKSLFATVALVLLISAPTMGEVRAGAWVKTEKSITQLLAEAFEIKSIYFVSAPPATVYLLHKNSALYECRLPSDRRRAECWILAEE